MRYKIKQLLKEKGITQERLAMELGTHPVTISKLLSGKIVMSDRWLERIAEALRVSPTELIDWDRKVPVVGYVGAGAQISPAPDIAHGAALEEIDLPWPAGPEAAAVIVRGDSMHPVYREGDILIYEDRHADPVHLLGRECVVALADGRMYVKELAKGSKPGLFTLLSWNAPPIYDTAVAWAAPVRYVKRNI